MHTPSCTSLHSLHAANCAPALAVRGDAAADMQRGTRITLHLSCSPINFRLPPCPLALAVREDAAADIKRGTRITLHLKPDALEFADANKLQVLGFPLVLFRYCCPLQQWGWYECWLGLEFANASKLQVG